MSQFTLQGLRQSPNAEVPNVPEAMTITPAAGRTLDDRLDTAERQLAKQTQLLEDLALLQQKGLRVQVMDLDIGFWSMVGLFVKAALAAIPALLILLFVGAVATGILTGVLAGLAR